MPLSQSSNQNSLGDGIVALVGTTTGGVPETFIGSDANGNILSADTIQSAISSGSITVSTTAVAARVGSSNLANRKMLMISPVGGTIYMGASSAVTAATGIPIYAGQVISLGFSANVTPYLIASASTTVNVFEGS